MLNIIMTSMAISRIIMTSMAMSRITMTSMAMPKIMMPTAGKKNRFKTITAVLKRVYKVN